MYLIFIYGSWVVQLKSVLVIPKIPKLSLARSPRQQSWPCSWGREGREGWHTISSLSITLRLANHKLLWAHASGRQSVFSTDVAWAAVWEGVVSWLHMPWKKLMVVFILCGWYLSCERRYNWESFVLSSSKYNKDNKLFLFIIKVPFKRGLERENYTWGRSSF